MRRRRKGNGSIIFSIILIAIIAAAVYLSQSPYFERNKPQIISAQTLYWNRKDPLKVVISDDVGIKYYKAVLSDDKEEISVISNKVDGQKDRVTLKIDYPKMGFRYKKTRFKLYVEAVDKSFWNFMAGNKQTAEITVVVDYKRPNVSITNNSYGITKGGSALVVFKAEDENLEDLFIKTNYDKRFEAIPFYKEGYYISLVAWPVRESSFSAHVIATDVAGNITKRRIPYYLKGKRYRTSNITLKESFLNGKITDLARQYAQFDDVMSEVGLFQAVNEVLREKNEELIDDASQIDDFSMISDWSVEPFYPLKNSAAVASFGDHRFYHYNGVQISEAYHVGLDLASIKHAAIKASNPGRVKYAQFNGIYGNMPLIDHGLGLHTLYGHCSSALVDEGTRVEAGEVIAETGKTGLALGDHLHFGVTVQGVAVRPEEWMDRNWIKLNIDNVIKDSKKLIDIQKH